jgi:transposase-like protein
VQQKNVVELETQAPEGVAAVLEQVLRQGAQRLLQSAIEQEVAAYIEAHQTVRDERNHRLVVRNGRLPGRELQTGLGPLQVVQPRVQDRRPGQRFTSQLLPPYLRRVPSLDALIPALYLHGVSTGDLAEALSAILGPQAVGLSPANIVRLKESWTQDYQAWQQRDLTGKRYVYWWADAIYFNVRLGDDRPCVLVLMGSLEDGTKELLAVVAGQRESQLSWQALLADLKRRGLLFPPKLAVADGGLGFWAALPEEFAGVAEQRCWVHKTATVLDKLPKSLQPAAKGQLQEMYMAPTRAQALVEYERFLKLYAGKYPKACECLRRDKDVLFAFYDYPAEHWAHLRTTNPIESTFATIRHRTRQTKGCGSVNATLAMVFQLARVAEKHWRRLNGYALLSRVLRGVKFVDGLEVASEAQAA